MEFQFFSYILQMCRQNLHCSRAHHAISILILFLYNQTHAWVDIITKCQYSGISEQRTLWDQYKFKWFVPCIEVVLFKFQTHYIDRGDTIWEFSFVHCGEVFNTVSLRRDSTVLHVRVGW